MNDDRIDAEIRAAFESIEAPEHLREALLPPPRAHWRSEAIFVGLAAAAALALFIPWMLVPDVAEPEAPHAAAPVDFQPPSGTRLVQLELSGAQEGWPEAGARVDVFAAVPSDDGLDVSVLLRDVPVAQTASRGWISVAVDPSLAVRAIHGGQTAALTLAVVLPDGRRVVELRETSPVDVGDVVDVLVTAEREGGLETWTALRGAEVVYLGEAGPLVALTEAEAAIAVAVQHQGAIRLSRHLD